LRAKEAARNYETRQDGNVLTGTHERLHAASNFPDWCLTQGLDSTQQGRIGRATTASRVHRPRPRQTPRDGPDSVLETASSGRRTSTFSTSCFLTASISSILGSEPSLYSRASSTHEPPTRPNLHRRRLPKLAARRSAVLRARLAACRAPCRASKAPPNQAGTPPPSGGTPHQWHRQPGQPSPATG